MDVFVFLLSLNTNIIIIIIASLVSLSIEYSVLNIQCFHSSLKEVLEIDLTLFLPILAFCVVWLKTRLICDSGSHSHVF